MEKRSMGRGDCPTSESDGGGLEPQAMMVNATHAATAKRILAMSPVPICCLSLFRLECMRVTQVNKP